MAGSRTIKHHPLMSFNHTKTALTTSAALSARTASCTAAIPTVRSTASTPPPTDRSFSWWIERARRSFAYAKPPNWATQTVPVPESPT